MPTLLTVEDEQMLEEIAGMTAEIRSHQASMARLGRARRRIERLLRDRGVTYKQIADRMGVSEQAVYADLRKP